MRAESEIRKNKSGSQRETRGAQQPATPRHHGPAPTTQERAVARKKPSAGQGAAAAQTPPPPHDTAAAAAVKRAAPASATSSPLQPTESLAALFQPLTHTFGSLEKQLKTA